MAPKRRLRFSLRTILVGVPIAAVAFLLAARYLERRVDYVDPPDYGKSALLTQAEVDRFVKESNKGRDVYASELLLSHPPLGITYWQQQAAKLEPGMTSFALFKYVPSASMSGSWQIPRSIGETTQVFYYAVDSEYAALCEMTTYGPGSPRIVKMLGFYSHDLRFTDDGSLNISKLDILSGPKPIVVFAD